MSGFLHCCDWCKVTFAAPTTRRRYCGLPCARAAARGVPQTDRFARFMDKVNITETCWLWTASTGRQGYGQYAWVRRVNRPAHRISYEIFVGPIPDGFQLDHLCRTTLCVRPDHLEPVTSRENTMRGIGPSARNARRSNCLRGHPFGGVNAKGKRVCRQCSAERDHLRWERKKAAAR